MRRQQKLLVSLFIALNLSTVLFANRPHRLDLLLDDVFRPGPQALRYVEEAGASVWRYAHLVGLDNRWEMFTVLSRVDWDYVITARYADSTPVLLPLPRQSPRTFWQRHVADYKEAKYHLNLYRARWSRESYAHYLCREFPSHRGVPVEAILFELRLRPFVASSAEAARRGTHYDGNGTTELLDSFLCPGARWRS